MRLDIPMHDALAVAIIQCLQQLVDVIPHIHVLEFGVQGAKVGIIDVFEDEGWCLGLTIADDVEEGDDVGAAGEVLEDFDFALDLLLFHGLEDFDDAFLVVDYIDAFEDFAVFTATCNKCE